MSSAEQLEDVEFDAPEENELGHLLKSINPKAAAEINNPPAPPDVGTWVVFKPRANVTRGFPFSRSEFPAVVLGTHDDGTLALIVTLEAEDVVMETRVPFQSHNQDAFCWRYRRGEDSADVAERIGAVEEFLRGEDKLGEIIEAIGKRVEVVEGVLASDEVETLEKRLETLEANWKLIEPLLKAAKKGK